MGMGAGAVHITYSCDNPIGTSVSRLNGVLVLDGGDCGIPGISDTLQGHRRPHGRGVPLLVGLGSCNKSSHSAAGEGALGLEG